jgi:hypothetical protein
MLEFQALDGYAVVQRGHDPCGQLRSGIGWELRSDPRGQLRTGTGWQLHAGAGGSRCRESDLLVVGSPDRQGR